MIAIQRDYARPRRPARRVQLERREPLPGRLVRGDASRAPRARASTSTTCTTRTSRSRARSAPSARPRSSCSTATAGSSTTARSTTAATRRRSARTTSATRSTRCSRASRPDRRDPAGRLHRQVARVVPIVRSPRLADRGRRPIADRCGQWDDRSPRRCGTPSSARSCSRCCAPGLRRQARSCRRSTTRGSARRRRRLRPLGAGRACAARRHRVELLPGLGVYSSDSRRCSTQQMAEIAARGHRRDRRLVVGEGLAGGPAPAGRDRRRVGAASIAVAAHIEPYTGRTVDSVVGGRRRPARARGSRRSTSTRPFDDPPADWAPANDRLRAEGVDDVRPDGARRAGGRRALQRPLHLRHRHLRRRQARPALQRRRMRVGLLCAPSVGPGYDARRATGDPHVKPRRHGLTYDSMWHAGDRRRRRRHHDHLVQRVAGGHADRARRPADPPRRVQLRLLRRRLEPLGRGCRDGISRPHRLLGQPVPRVPCTRKPPDALAYSSACGSSRAHRVRAARAAPERPDDRAAGRDPDLRGADPDLGRRLQRRRRRALRGCRRSPTRSTATSPDAGMSSRRSARSPTRSPTGC